MPKQLYVGYSRDHNGMEAFRSEAPPTFESHGSKYDAVIGPFRTVRGAKIMALYGNGNPHIRCVDDAEAHARASKKNTSPKYGDIPAILPECPIF